LAMFFSFSGPNLRKTSGSLPPLGHRLGVKQECPRFGHAERAAMFTPSP
jgi:hypothetical protein